MTAFSIDIGQENYIKTPVEISSEILKYLKEMASSYLRTDIKEAVISIPAYFNNAQRIATRKAATMAGLHVLRLIAEPTAAALHYVDEKSPDGKLLVFDWGGGTLDVSLIEIFNDEIIVVAVDGETALGGRDIDEELFRYFYESAENHGKRSARRLMRECIRIKRDLSNLETISTTIECYYGEEHLKLTLNRQKLEELAEGIFKRTFEIVQRLLSTAGWNAKHIDKVILVGGSTRIPKIRNILGTYFGEDKIRTDLNPDEAVALGACVHAAILNKRYLVGKIYNIVEVTPVSLGIRANSNLMIHYIKKNSRLPAVQEKVVCTTRNNQKSATFEIYEGEWKNIERNSKLSQFVISGLPMKRAGEVEFTIRFELDMDGLLTVSASETTSGKTKALTICIHEFAWTQQNNVYSTHDEEMLRREDEEFEQLAIIKNNHLHDWELLMHEIKKCPSTESRKRVIDAHNEYIEYSRKLHYTVEELDAKYKELKYSLKDIVC